MPEDRDEVEQVSAGCTADSVARYFLDDESVGEDKFKRAGSRDIISSTGNPKIVRANLMRANSGMPAFSESQERSMRSKQHSEY